MEGGYLKELGNMRMMSKWSMMATGKMIIQMAWGNLNSLIKGKPIRGSLNQANRTVKEQ